MDVELVEKEQLYTIVIIYMFLLHTTPGPHCTVHKSPKWSHFLPPMPSDRYNLTVDEPTMINVRYVSDDIVSVTRPLQWYFISHYLSLVVL